MFRRYHQGGNQSNILVGYEIPLSRDANGDYVYNGALSADRVYTSENPKKYSYWLIFPGLDNNISVVEESGIPVGYGQAGHVSSGSMMRGSGTYPGSWYDANGSKINDYYVFSPAEYSFYGFSNSYYPPSGTLHIKFKVPGSNGARDTYITLNVTLTY